MLTCRRAVLCTLPIKLVCAVRGAGSVHVFFDTYYRCRRGSGLARLIACRPTVTPVQSLTPATRIRLRCGNLRCTHMQLARFRGC